MLVFLDDKGKGRSDDKWDDQRYLKVLSRWRGSELKLNSAKVGDSGVLAIIRKVSESGKLAKLELRNDSILSTGFEYISNFLVTPASVNLTSLNLFGNDAGEKGARYCSFPQILRGPRMRTEPIYLAGASPVPCREIRACLT
jgi:hypothetical protein